MHKDKINPELLFVMQEIFSGQGSDSVFLDDADAALLNLLEELSPAEARAATAGASVAAHVRHVSFSLEAYRLAISLEDASCISDHWPEWEALEEGNEDWEQIRQELKERLAGFLHLLEHQEDFSATQLRFALGALAHMAFHLGVIQVKLDMLKGNN